MRALVPALCIAWGILLPTSPGSAQSQAPEPPCLEPAPHFLSNHPTTPFVTPQGKLCQTFRYSEGNQVEPQLSAERTLQPGKAFILSAIVPGAGQWFHGQSRWPAYLAVELWSWLQYLDWRREGHDLQAQYKDLAWFVARRVSTGPRTDAGWEYYESLTRFQSSGAYDSDPLKEGVQPEENPTTFNGSIWALAQEIYIPVDSEDPPGEGSEPYQSAYEYYLSRAYAPELAWEWGANTLHQGEYTSLIREADEALRSSTGMIGVIIANHLLSAVDALVSGRLGIAGRIDPSVEVLLIPGPFNTRGVALSVRIPNPMAYVH